MMCGQVGDPQQLPATIFSQTGGSTAFERSLFERLEHCGHPVHLLDTQVHKQGMMMMTMMMMMMMVMMSPMMTMTTRP
jgi:hypothetical protein